MRMDTAMVMDMDMDKTCRRDRVKGVKGKEGRARLCRTGDGRGGEGGLKRRKLLGHWGVDR